MIPPSFDYASPSSLSEALSLLKRGGEDAKILAGGQSLIPLLKLRLASPSLLIDINQIQGLDYIRESQGQLRVGALTRMADLETSDLIRKKYAIIHEASTEIADPTVRNLGTVGGNISHGDPANDLPAVMLALDAEFHAEGSGGGRDLKANAFFVDTFTTALKHDEILTEVRVPMATGKTGGCYMKIEKRIGDFAIAGVGAQVTLSSRGEFDKVGIGLTAVGSTAIKAKNAEDLLKGKKPTDGSALSSAAALASEATNPSSDLRGPADYKRSVVKVLTLRALNKAAQRAQVGV
jgi:carbon-monoxide dehydrogenase medium subunit